MLRRSFLSVFWVLCSMPSFAGGGATEWGLVDHVYVHGA